MDRKTAAQKLLDIADAIDKEAAELSYFVCASCNHTASLSSINFKREKAASEAGLNDVEAVSVNDVIACPACAEDMNYIPTDMSERFYVEAAEGEVPEPELPNEGGGDPLPPPEPPTEEEPKPKKPKKPKVEEEDLAAEDIFKPVDEQKSEDDGLVEDSADDDEGGDNGADDGDGVDISYEGDVDEEDETAPGDGADEGEEDPVEEKPKKAPKKKKDKPDDGKASFPKEQAPKFEFPKKAGDESFESVVAKYL